MISKGVKYYCCEDISLIENYNEAINDNTQTWDCHHKKEIDEKLTVKQLKELGLYFYRPSNELIFLTHDEHIKLHGNYMSKEIKNKISESNKGKSSWNKGITGYKNKPCSEETKLKISKANKGRKLTDEMKKKHSESMINYYKTHDGPRKGKNNSKEINDKIKDINIGKKMANKDGVNTWAFKNEIQNYSDDGWKLGKYKL